MRENMPGVARPVRMAANSSFANSTARSIFSSASKRVSSITWSLASFECAAVLLCRPYGPVRVAAPDRPARRGDSGRWRGGGDQCADPFAAEGPHDRVGALSAEDQHGQAVVLAEAERRRVDHAQVAP